jgi:hypothetical protein
LREKDKQLTDKDEFYQKQLTDKDKHLQEKDESYQKQLTDKDKFYQKQLTDKDKHLQEKDKFYQKQLTYKDKHLQEKDEAIRQLFEKVVSPVDIISMIGSLFIQPKSLVSFSYSQVFDETTRNTNNQVDELDNKVKSLTDAEKNLAEMKCHEFKDFINVVKVCIVDIISNLNLNGFVF